MSVILTSGDTQFDWSISLRPANPQLFTLSRFVDAPSLIVEGTSLTGCTPKTDRAEFMVRYELRVPVDVDRAQLLYPAGDWPDVIISPFLSGAMGATLDGNVVRFDCGALVAGEMIYLEVGFVLGSNRPSGICASIPWDLPTPWLVSPQAVGVTRGARNVAWVEPGSDACDIAFRPVFEVAAEGPLERVQSELCVARVSSEFERDAHGSDLAVALSKGVQVHKAFVHDVVHAAAEAFGTWWHTPRLRNVSIVLEQERGAFRTFEAPGIIVLPKGFAEVRPAQLPDVAFSIARQLCRSWLEGLLCVVRVKDSVDYEAFLAALAIAVMRSLGLGWPQATLGSMDWSKNRLVEIVRRPRRVLTKVGRAQYEALRLSDLIRQIGTVNIASTLASHFAGQVTLTENRCR